MTLLRASRFSLCKMKHNLWSTQMIISNLYLMNTHCVHKYNFCTHENDHDNGIKIKDSSKLKIKQQRIPKRILRKLSKLKSESPKNSEIKLFLEDKEANIKQVLGEFQTQSDSPPDFEPEFPSDTEKFLKWYRSQSRKSYCPKVDPRKTSIILFPGQGSQFVGMGKKLLPYPSVKEIYDAASEILKYDLLKLCLSGPKSELDKTIHCQPAILVTSIAAIEKLKEDHPQAVDNCVGAAGFSVGEYAALVFAGVLSLEDALEVVKVRAEAMQKASEENPSGMMTAFFDRRAKIGFALYAAREYCQQRLGITSPVCGIANYLYPECKVIAGNKEALEFVKNNAKEFGIKRLKRLPVSGAFHTELMRSAASPLRNVLQRVELQKSLISVHSNVDATRHKDKTIIKNLIKQVYKPVKWEQTIHALYSRDKGENFPYTYEVGPGNHLGILLKMTNMKAYEQYTDVEV